MNKLETSAAGHGTNIKKKKDNKYHVRNCEPCWEPDPLVRGTDPDPASDPFLFS